MGKHGKYRALVASLALAALAGPAAADCRLALALGLDVSASMDAEEYTLQRNGLAAALLAPEVEAALMSTRPVELAVFEWSGGHRPPAMVLDWQDIESAADVVRAAEAVARSERSRNDMPTAMGRMLAFASDLFRRGPDCDRRVLDVSGDGIHNDGYPPKSAYKYFPLDGVTVNGLVVLGSEDDVLGFYRREVIHGPGAFVETAGSYADFERAMTRKLVREALTMAVSAGDARR